jgi:hypothetical protein
MTKQQVFEALEMARQERARADRIEGYIGGTIFTVLGSCVLYTITLWLVR